MAEKACSSSARRMLARRCVRCGYDGMIHAAPLLPGSFDPQAEPWPQSCPSCGCDFAQRPPRSYAEMEGLLGRPLSLDCPPRSGRIESSLIQRWLAFLFFVMLLFVALIHLTAATFQAR